MTKKKESFLFISLAILFISLFFSCKAKSEKTKILELMDKTGEYVEKKDVESLMSYIADDYSDFRGLNKSETEEMAKHYFLEYQGIVTHVLSTKIDEITTDGASIQTDVLVSSGGAQLFRKFVKFAGDYYRIKARLVKRDETWLLHYAEWTHISLEGLFPESLSLLKKIFPNVSP